MTSHFQSFVKNIPQQWGRLWSGSGGHAWPGMLKLFWGTLRLFLANWMWGTAVRLAHFQPPVKTSGVVLAVISVLLIIWGLWGLWRGILILGLKRLLITLIFIWALVITFNVFTIPDTDPLPSRLLTQLNATRHQAWSGITGLGRSVIQGPDEFLFAYTGRRAPLPPPPGFPTPDPNVKPIQAIAVRADESPSAIQQPVQQTPSMPVPDVPDPTTLPEQSHPAEMKIGGYAQVIDTDGDPLRARAEPGTTFEIVARFPEGSRLHILEGPQAGDGFNWWKVEGEQGEGWCADQWLVPVE